MKLTLSIEKDAKPKTEEKKCAPPSKGAGRRQSVISVWFKIHMRFFSNIFCLLRFVCVCVQIQQLFAHWASPVLLFLK